MPLTKDNMSLLKKEHYDYFLNRMMAFSKDSKAQFINMNNHSTFIKEDFHDGVHMNARGGIKFVRLLSDELTENPQTLKTLKTAALSSKVKVFAHSNKASSK